MICIIEECLNDAEEQFCTAHYQSMDNIEKSFADWKNAYNDRITKEDYLQRLTQSDDVNAGQYVREIAIYLLNNKFESNE